jgi:DNA primase
MAFISRESIQELNDKLDAVAIVDDYVRLEKKSGRYWGLCPFHSEKTPSFTVDPERKMYHCFGCGKGGNIINFVMEMDKVDFPEAVETLARRTGIELVYENTGREPSGEQDRKKKTGEINELYRRVAGTFHYFLTENPEGKEALRYILSRKIGRETIDRFRLGYSPANRTWLFDFLVKKGYSEDFLASSGLFSKNYPRVSFFSGRLMFPIADRNGRIIAFGGRILPSEAEMNAGPKYINSRESELYKKRETLFAIDLALQEIRKTEEVFLCEGYMDVIAMHEAGIYNAVAPLGTAFTDDQAKLLRRWAGKLNLVFDSDKAGQNAAVKAILTARRNHLSCAVAVPGLDPEAVEPVSGPDLKDPADILQFFGPGTLQKRMKCFINDFEYLLVKGKDLYDISNPEGKAKAAAFLFPYFETLDSDITRDDCIGAAADAFRTEKEAVLRDFNRRHSDPPRRGADQNERAGNERQFVMNDELYLLTVVAVNPQWYTEFRAALEMKEIEDPDAKELFVALEECFVNDESGLAALLSKISSDPLRNYITEKGNSDEFSGNAEKLIRDGIRHIKAKRLRRRLNEIVIKLRRMKHGEGEGSAEEPDDLLAEKMRIDSELRQLEGK